MNEKLREAVEKALKHLSVYSSMMCEGGDCYDPECADMEVKKAAELLRAALQEPQQEPPKGYKLVPIEPTPRMIAAMAVEEATGSRNGVTTIGMAGAELAYEAMLAASEEPK